MQWMVPSQCLIQGGWNFSQLWAAAWNLWRIQVRTQYPVMADRYNSYGGLLREMAHVDWKFACFSRMRDFFLQRCVPRMCTGSEPFLWQIAVIRQAWAQLIKEESENIGSSLMTVIRAAWPLHKGWHAQNERQWTSRTRLRFHVKSHDFFSQICVFTFEALVQNKSVRTLPFSSQGSIPGCSIRQKGGPLPHPCN
jgi:hypothetical protein